ncbi:type II toxin-antitoxin system PemK/MazF family toxin [Fischerella sp. PCC 9605]|uniref:type II toxin-antitoxin system PemK/MazF family toxin n=1 Tax=Fischerella sp. PCC 9605 TaxID=1173024 RepID=UPI00047A06C0|nr:type II toxin-antitoxin system PemK/MazF family toxin [Fischerella sp. PCC 9605]
MTSSEPKRGEIWRVQLDPTRGDEIQKTRPAIVISADGLEGLKLRLVIPITGWKPAFSGIPWIVQITPSLQNGLTKASAANPLQTRSVSVERFTNKLGVLEEKKLEAVVLALAVVVQYP